MVQLFEVFLAWLLHMHVYDGKTGNCMYNLGTQGQGLSDRFTAVTSLSTDAETLHAGQQILMLGHFPP